MRQWPRRLRHPPQRLPIDTHLEVWTLAPKFPFNHPESGKNLKVEIAAPIENQVEQMRDFGLRYAVLINPRYFGWDNSYIAHCLKSYSPSHDLEAQGYSKGLFEFNEHARHATDLALQDEIPRQ